MDPPTIIKTFKYNSPQQPMFNVIETPLHYKSSFAQNNSNFQDISFSSYLKPKDSPQNSQKKIENGSPPIDDTEISIFDAQKYFSETNDPKDSIKECHDLQSVPRMSSVSSVDGYGRNFRTRSFHATPTASSEASWNSQTGLLANPPGSNGVSMRNSNFHSDRDKKRSFISRKWNFGRKCCCTGKKSVQVKEKPSDRNDQNNNVAKSNYSYTKRDHGHKEKAPVITKTSPVNGFSPENDFSRENAPRQQRVSASGRAFGDGFSFPVLKPSIQETKIVTKTIINPMEDPPRDSLDVFQPVHEQILISGPSSIDNPVANARQHFNLGSPIARVTNTDDDVGSDASSDLFEIESFSTQTTSYPMYRRRDSLDEAPCTFNARRFNGRRSLDEPPTPSVAATECYAPSEVSVDWSVTTAEGFDRASVSNFSVSASEIGNMALMRRRQEESGGGDDGGRVRKGNGGLLMMSCRQEKAVSVGPQPVKCVAEGPPLAMFPMHVGGRPPRSSNNPASARVSLAFAA
ncbi:hypothetical protein BUALT_Bualt12G0049500 [Buddleja alternifolia]|uniref:Phytochrome kinase substrate 1 n=1 Tax=Buddleja alternifolia TaxID=168488 RepID=A0AAV6WP00_9LAMI|nr:hypothetical protein BUALT_Bualt12G0049500 [Buddleja alternifolia]